LIAEIFSEIGLLTAQSLGIQSAPLPKTTNHHTYMANLTKRDLVMQISKQTGLTQQEVFSVIQLTLDGITEALSTGSDVELRNFGVFEVRLTKSRVGRNPNKPEHDVVIPARATVKFKSGKIMRQRVLLRTEELRGKQG
jgi:nucleoid DNA-binding protein